MSMLTSVVDTLDGGEAMRDRLEDPDRRHVAYGVQPEHYDVLLSALVWAFGRALDYEFDAETKTAWEKLLRTVSKVMLECASAQVPA